MWRTGRLRMRSIVVAVAAVAIGCLDRPVGVSTPTVTALVVIKSSTTTVSKIDLLFMIDNSPSMADKQKFLQKAVPDLMKRLVDPVCVDANDNDAPDDKKPDPVTGQCPVPYRRDFEPVRDIHVGVISSSLGGHGTPHVCDDAIDMRIDHHDNDASHLLTRGATVAGDTLQSKGFLSWNPSASGSPSNADGLVDSFKTLIGGVGQHGCGHEAQLEAVYRFLNDPEPYEHLVLADGLVSKQGVDQTLLKERADFLRPDSLVAVISVTDENDYSVVDSGQNWLVLAEAVNGSSLLRRPSSACLTNPNDRCCYNCGQTTVPAGCPTPDVDTECKKSDKLSSKEDPSNLRASRSKQQYGVDFLYSVEKYIEGFTQPILTRFGGGAPNPLFHDVTCQKKSGCPETRGKDLVFWAGIVGVPWQDIARDKTDLGKGFQNAKELVDGRTWDLILGDPKASPPTPPTDLHMLVSPVPRAGLPGPESAANGDDKNGHEWMSSEGSPPDLQYACTFELPETRDCGGGAEDCDCATSDKTKSPLCQDPATGAYSTVQRRAKGYPGLRELEVLRGIGAQGIVASICPSNSTHPEKPNDYGYRPAIQALVERLRGALRNACLPRPLAVAADGSVPCVVLEAFTPDAGDTCNCHDPKFPGRIVPSEDRMTDDIRALDRCVCEVTQLEGADRTTCQKETTPSHALNGWCYVDPNQDGDDSECSMVEKCQPTDRRILRHLGAQPRGTVVIMCEEKTFLASAATVSSDVCAARVR